MFNKVQRMLKSNPNQRKLYEKLNEETPLRALITCSKCGSKLTSSASKGRSRYYNYYHCRNGCTERIPAEVAHEALLNYFDEVAVKPEIEKLYLEVMGTIFKANESNREQENAVICVLRGFEQNFKKERASKTRSFLSGSPDRNRTCIKSLGNFYSIH